MVELFRSFLIPPSDCDRFGHLTSESMQKYLGCISDLHADLLGCGWEEMRKIATFWVISRFRIRWFRRPKSGETLTVHTWPNPAGITGVDRNYRIFDGNDCPVAEAMSKWSIVEIGTFRVLRGTSFPLLKTGLDYSAEQVFPDGFPRIPSLDDGEGASLPMIVSEEDIDANGHMNNARYITRIEAAARQMLGRNLMLGAYQISYLSQLFAKEAVTMKLAIHGRHILAEGFVLRLENRVKIFQALME